MVKGFRISLHIDQAKQAVIISSCILDPNDHHTILSRLLRQLDGNEMNQSLEEGCGCVGGGAL